MPPRSLSSRARNVGLPARSVRPYPATHAAVSLLERAVQGDLQALQELTLAAAGGPLAQGPSPAALLHLAAQHGHVGVLKALIDLHGVDPNAPRAGGITALYLAAQNGHLDAVEALMSSHGVDADLAAAQGESPLFIAAQHGHAAVVRRLLRDPRLDVNRARADGATPLLVACATGSTGVVHALIDEPAVQINRGNRLGVRPLYIAARNDFRRIGGLLLSRAELDPTLARHDGETALDAAVRRGHREFVHMLLALRGGPDGSVRPGSRTGASMPMPLGAVAALASGRALH